MERAEVWKVAASDYQRYTPEAAEAQISTLLGQVNANILESAQDVEKGAEGATAAAVQFDVSAVAKLITPAIRQTQAAAFNVVSAAAKHDIATALEGDSTHAYLTAEERTKFREAIAGNRFGEATLIQLHATVERGADAETAKKIKANAEKDAGLLDKFAKLTAGIPKGGDVGATGATSSSSQPKNEQEAINWHATGKWTTAQKRAWDRKQQE